MRIDPAGRVKDIASLSEEAEHLLESWGVDFCCKGDESLREACAKAGINPVEVERRLRELPDAVPHMWDDVADLVDYVLGSCYPRTRDALERAREVVREARAPGDARYALAAALDELASLSDAQMKAEEDLFGQVRALAEARSARGPFPAPPFTTVRDHEQPLRERHERIHDQLRRVHALARAPEIDSIPLRRAVDALVHATVAQMHLVDNELVPRARSLEPE
jgi:regulator of cell morphogenesis and NO signaling